MIHGILSKFNRSLLTRYFKMQTHDNKFCIISNDCWGAEIYKLLNREFNTPFIGLMLMGPCYIKLLSDPFYFMNLPLNFRQKSKYPEMQEINAGIDFPMAVLGDSTIEVHFLHYKSTSDAEHKWMRRLKRMDWDNLFIKYDCGKDYADTQTVQSFINLPYPNKLLFGKENFGFNEVIIIKDYPKNAVKQFRSCFLSFSPIGWLKGKAHYNNAFQKYIGKLSFKYV